MDHSLYDQQNENMEKVYIHFDRDNYFLGDQMWFKVYLLDGVNHSPYAKSKVVYVELIDPDNRIVDIRTIHLVNGGGEGEFGLDIGTESGVYTVRAYTNFMRNFDDSFFFHKKMNINSFKQLKKEQQEITSEEQGEGDRKEARNALESNGLKPDLQFFPEGGSMIQGLPARIGFKAINDAGQSFDVQGVILDHREQELISFESSHAGMGSFTIVPETSKDLKAKIRYAGKEYYYELPKVLEKGVIIRVIDRGDSYQINLQSSLKQGVNGLSLIGEQRGVVICRANLTGNKEQGSLKVPFSTLDNGIVKFTVFDKNNKPICERLVFAATNRTRPEVSLESAKKNFEQREFIEFDLSLMNDSGLPANVSVSVTDMTSNNVADCDSDIVSYLLLDSEIRGDIENPCYYFETESSERKRDLDLLMMTQGWRNYLWNQEEVSDQRSQLFTVETGKDFKGSIRSSYNYDKTVHSEVSLTYKNGDIFGHDESKTFGKGRFLFPGYTFKDSISIIIEAKKKLVKKGKKANSNEVNRDFYIVMDTFASPSISFEPSRLSQDRKRVLDRYQEIQDAEYLEALYADQPDYVKLDGVEVRAKREPYVDPYRRKTMRYAQPRFRVDYKKENIVALGNDVLWTFLNRTPGISRYNPRLSTQSTVAGVDAFYYRGSRIVFFLDGIRFSSANELNNVITANDVSFIDLLSGPQATVYLCEAAVVVYTKTAEERLAYGNSGPRKGIINFNYPGIYKAKEFYEPVYDTGKGGDMEDDYRITLHWEPTLKLYTDRKTKLSFYAADPDAKYRIELEGITLEGYPVRVQTYFEVGN
ncbi:hypothetical protein [Lutimonas sp.]|uniref:hypothetical protein n=1 Tax=Lutimonas sp. TaxID=1872403 RepID=UPI003D9BA261